MAERYSSEFRVLYACGCIAATALGAVKRGIQACILRDGVATVYDEPKVMKTTEKLKRIGVQYV